jgi:hypothetical protein
MGRSHIVAGLALLSLLAVVQAGQRNPEKDRQTITQLESEWLVARDAATFDRILADDFVHPVPTGDFLTKAQHMDWFTRHQPPENLKFRFDGLRVRLYGDLGIANGTVVTSDEHGRDIERTVFTDVFVYRSGHWQAINAQETLVRKPPSR